VNIPLFCKDFNARTAHMAADKMPVPVFITVYSDRTFEFKVGTPPASALLRKAAGAAKGSGEPNKKKIGTITEAQLSDIATTKLPDLNTSDHAAAVRTIAGTAKSMGININN
jgi:large subunit ribosomal protein L11